VPRVDFYLLRTGQAREKLLLACRIASRAYQAGKTVYIKVPDASTSDALDELLWTFDQGSFVPHRRESDVDTEIGGTPVVIGHRAQYDSQPEVLISLIQEVPTDYASYERIAELVGAGDDEKANARERYRYYRGKGCELFNHDIEL